VQCHSALRRNGPILTSRTNPRGNETGDERDSTRGRAHLSVWRSAELGASVGEQHVFGRGNVNIGAYVATGVPHALNGITVENDHAVPPAPTFDQWFARSLFSGLPVGGEVIGFGDVDLEDNLDFCDSISGVTCFGGGFLLGHSQR
jgi:hypothetical protein